MIQFKLARCIRLSTVRTCVVQPVYLSTCSTNEAWYACIFVRLTVDHNHAGVHLAQTVDGVCHPFGGPGHMYI